MENQIKIREYRPSDCKELTELFYNTVHTVNRADYTKEQLDAWAPGGANLQEWNRSFLENECLVAVKNHMIIGFGDISKTGYLDRLYVHKDHQKKGVGSAICTRLEKTIGGKIVTHASITARPFFENRGYKVIKKQQVKRRGVVLTNFVMEFAGVKEGAAHNESDSIEDQKVDGSAVKYIKIIRESEQE